MPLLVVLAEIILEPGHPMSNTWVEEAVSQLVDLPDTFEEIYASDKPVER